MEVGGKYFASESFYRSVVQEVLLFGAETWVLLAAMSKNMEGVHVGFLWKVTVKMARRQWDGTWRRVDSESVLKEVETQTLGTYINRRKTALAEWVVLQPIYEVCDRYTSYEGGGEAP